MHGVPYVHPAKRPARCYGIPTAHSAEPLCHQLAIADDDPLVWPHPHGETFGDAIDPHFRSVPEAARRDPRMHRRLALVDALRIGRTRERKMAIEMLDQEFGR